MMARNSYKDNDLDAVHHADQTCALINYDDDDAGTLPNNEGDTQRADAAKRLRRDKWDCLVTETGKGRLSDSDRCHLFHVGSEHDFVGVDSSTFDQLYKYGAGGMAALGRAHQKVIFKPRMKDTRCIPDDLEGIPLGTVLWNANPVRAMDPNLKMSNPIVLPSYAGPVLDKVKPTILTAVMGNRAFGYTLHTYSGRGISAVSNERMSTGFFVNVIDENKERSVVKGISESMFIRLRGVNGELRMPCVLELVETEIQLTQHTKWTGIRMHPDDCEQLISFRNALYRERDTSLREGCACREVPRGINPDQRMHKGYGDIDTNEAASPDVPEFGLSRNAPHRLQHHASERSLTNTPNPTTTNVAAEETNNNVASDPYTSRGRSDSKTQPEQREAIPLGGIDKSTGSRRKRRLNTGGGMSYNRSMGSSVGPRQDSKVQHSGSGRNPLSSLASVMDKMVGPITNSFKRERTWFEEDSQRPSKKHDAAGGLSQATTGSHSNTRAPNYRGQQHGEFRPDVMRRGGGNSDYSRVNNNGKGGGGRSDYSRR